MAIPAGASAAAAAPAAHAQTQRAPAGRDRALWITWYDLPQAVRADYLAAREALATFDAEIAGIRAEIERGAALEAGPHLGDIGGRNEDHAVAAALAIDRVKVLGEVLAPKVCLLVLVIEHSHLAGAEIARDLSDKGPVLAGEGEHDVVGGPQAAQHGGGNATFFDRPVRPVGLPAAEIEPAREFVENGSGEPALLGEAEDDLSFLGVMHR